MNITVRTLCKRMFWLCRSLAARQPCTNKLRVCVNIIIELFLMKLHTQVAESKMKTRCRRGVLAQIQRNIKRICVPHTC